MSEQRKRQKCCRPHYVVIDKYGNSHFEPGDYRWTISYNIQQLRRQFPGHEVFEIPCGHCALCVKAKISAWCRCLTAELLTSSYASFYTLTFDDDNLPATLEAAKHIFQCFIKRLRKRGLKFKYFCVSEHGEQFGRLHFHCLFFGLPPQLQEVKDEWSYGFIDSSVCSIGRINYTAGYMFKEHGLRLYSKGLGYQYFDDLRRQNRKIDMYDKYVIAPRRYYRKTRWSEQEREDFARDISSRESYNDLQLRALNERVFVQMKRKKQL